MITGWRELPGTNPFKVWAANQTGRMVKLFSVAQHPITNRYLIGINDMSKVTIDQMLTLAKGGILENDDSFTVLGISFSTIDAAKAHAEELDKLENTEASINALDEHNISEIAKRLRL